jgi:DNA-binding MarR family transcriptional regulator
MSGSKTAENRLRELLERLRGLQLMRIPPNLALTPTKIRVLYQVHHSPGLGILELAECLSIKGPSASVSARELVQSGWLQEQPHPDDGRAKCLYLTERSETLLQEIRSKHREILKSFLSGLDDDEQATFLNLLEKAVSNMEETKDKVS